MISYGFTKESSLPFEKVREAVTEELQKEGFGILTEIDLREKFKEKLGVDFKRYVILGACNPPNAYKSVQAEENIGLMLPCNVIIYERGNRTVLSIVRPTVAMQMIDNVELKSIAELIEKKLKNVFDAVP
ncbi:MAG TPA: DUF302 domain-containing protein [Syntrophales bacterium]|nr:DUF302 domain-containing protein [Syntrophales bacterium]